MPKVDDKPDVMYLEDAESGKTDDRVQSIEVSHADMKSITRRIDWRLIPALGILFGISLMDRKNIANASIAGLRTDLGLETGYRYALIASGFFITYVLAQMPMTIICRKMGPRYFLSGVCAVWGCLIVGFGFINDWVVMFALRLILGILEAGYYPGCAYLLQTWYLRDQIAVRYGIFYFVGSFASALSDILAFGLMQMENVGGLRGWRWIFVGEGIITTAIAILCFFVLPMFPDQERKKPSPRFLNSHELELVNKRLNDERGDVDAEDFSWALYFSSAKDFEIFGFAMMQFFICTASYAYTFYLPIILVDSLGFSVGASQCLNAPPYAFAGFLIWFSAWYGDRKQLRAPIIIVVALIGLVGLSIIGFVSNPWGRYVGAFVAISAINSNIPLIMTYQAVNIRGQWKRAFSVALMTSFGGSGGVAGSYIFRTQDAPNYIPGVIAVMACMGLTVVFGVILLVYFKRQNARADRGEIVINKSPDFRYTI